MGITETTVKVHRSNMMKKIKAGSLAFYPARLVATAEVQESGMTARPPFNHLHFADARLDVERRANGEMILRSPQQIEPYPNQLGFYLRRWAKEKPDVLVLAERAPDGSWRRVVYSEMLSAVEALGQAFIDRGMSVERPLMVLSEKSIDLAMMTLASTPSRDGGRLLPSRNHLDR